MSKFKVGDRVRRVGATCYVPLGTEGEVVLTATKQIEVRWGWDRYVAAYDEAQQSEWIELVSPRIALTVDAAIASYTLACEQFEAAELEVERAKAAVRDARLALRDALDGEA